MILPRFDKCPICSRRGIDNGWKHINHNSIWWEYKCGTYFTQEETVCEFSQYFFKSYEDPELKYYQFYTKDYHVYVYSDDFGIKKQTIGLTNPNGQTYFYHRKFPRGENTRGPFQVWDQFPIDWDNLDKLNDKLNLYKKFL